MTASFILRVVGEGFAACRPTIVASKNQQTIVVSRIVEVGGSFLFNSLSLSTSWHGHKRTSLSISHVCASGEVDLRPWLVLRKKRPKSQHVVNFRTTETKQLPFIVEGWRHISSCLLSVEKTKNIIWDMEETQIPKSCRAKNTERKEKKFSFEWIQTPKRIPKEKTCPRGKRQLLILLFKFILLHSCWRE